MLIRKNMNQHNPLAKANEFILHKDANSTTGVLLKLCETIGCHIEDILETKLNFRRNTLCIQ